MSFLTPKGPSSDKPISRGTSVDDHAKKHTDSPVARYALAFIGLGIVLSLATAYANLSFPPVPRSFSAAVLDWLLAIGLTSITAGVFSIILQMSDWRHYFSTGLSDIVLRQEYLEQLNKEELGHLQVKTLRAMYRTAEVDREGSLFNYYQTSLHEYLTVPYREDASVAMVVVSVEGERVLIDETTSYICRTLSGSIQQAVYLATDLDELKLQDLDISLVFPPSHPRANEGRKYIKGVKDDLLEERDSSIVPGGKEYSLSLESYRTVDKLKVIIHIRYTVEMQRFQYWQMAVPTMNFDIHLKYPEDKLNLQTKAFVPYPLQAQEIHNNGFYSYRYDSWMLPLNGLAWKLSAVRNVRKPPIQ